MALKGLVLAGGDSTRMGMPKAVINYHGMPQWQFVQNLLYKYCEQVFVSVKASNDTIDAPQILDQAQLMDCGPLAGLMSAHAAYPQDDWFIVAVDYPFFELPDFRHLHAGHIATKHTTVMRHADSDFFEPWLGIYTSEFLQSAAKHIAKGENSLQRIFRQLSIDTCLPLDASHIVSCNSTLQMHDAQRLLSMRKGLVKTNVLKYKSENYTAIEDELAVEEPLEIAIEYGAASSRETTIIAVTMRTPGHDEQLALGFLYTEQIIKQFSEVQEVQIGTNNRVTVLLHEDATPQLQQAQRNFYTTSSCGICGKASIEAVQLAFDSLDLPKNQRIDEKVLFSLPKQLNETQTLFARTGAVHASALFDVQGNLLAVFEDVGRHNALDKLVGHCFREKQLPLHNHILLLSGRASFELIQKALGAGIGIVCSIGAPSSLAVQLANDSNILLIGFLKADKFVQYTLL
jgi:FdhD protein